MLWGRGNVPATPGQLRALFDDPLCKKLIYQLWTAQALAKLDPQGMPEDPLSDLTARQLGMIDAVAEALDRIPYDVDELVPADSPRTVIDDGGEGQAAPDEGTPDEEATQRCRAAEERRYRLVIELRRRSDEEAERRSTATVIMPACMPTCTTPPPPPPPPPPPRLELLPLELLGLLLVFLPAVEDVAACLCAARLFGSAWGGASAEVKPTPHAPRPTPHAPRPAPRAPRPAPHAPRLYVSSRRSSCARRWRAMPSRRHPAGPAGRGRGSGGASGGAAPQAGRSC
jgi:hypothetical protein